MDRFSVTQAIQPKTNDGQSPACLKVAVTKPRPAPNVVGPAEGWIDPRSIERWTRLQLLIA